MLVRKAVVAGLIAATVTGGLATLSPSAAWADYPSDCNVDTIKGTNGVPYAASTICRLHAQRAAAHCSINGNTYYNFGAWADKNRFSQATCSAGGTFLGATIDLPD